MRNHRTERECWVAVKRGKPKDDGTFWYVVAVEEALCFGWIDSTVKKTAEEITVQKLSPRKARGNWTELNKERCRRLERLGLMTEAGRAVWPDGNAIRPRTVGELPTSAGTLQAGTHRPDSISERSAPCPVPKPARQIHRKHPERHAVRRVERPRKADNGRTLSGRARKITRRRLRGKPGKAVRSLRKRGRRA